MNALGRDLKKIVSDAVLTEQEDLFAYSSDATHHSKWVMPDAVVLPNTAEEVSKIMRYASEHQVPVTPRGAGSGITGGCTPLKGGIVLDTKRMREILEINRQNMTAEVEAGVVLGQFQKVVEKQKLFYPPDPQSFAISTIGGNVATRAGGPRGVKYGCTNSYVLGLEFVLPDGSIINPGSSCVKQSVGYDLTHLISGSEGTLGIITKVILRLLPLPPAHRTVLVAAETMEQAAEMVSEIIASGTVPAMLEYIPEMAIMAMNKYVSPPIEAAGGEAYLLIDVDGTETQVIEDGAAIERLCNDLGALRVRVIDNEKEAESYWLARAKLMALAYEFIKKMISEDVTVPRNRLPELVRSIREIATETGAMIGLAGHAGDGNIHPNILMPEITEEAERSGQEAIELIMLKALELGGTISGEHGVGWHKANFVPIECGALQVELMKKIKRVFDPAGIMNPGKIWPDVEEIR